VVVGGGQNHRFGLFDGLLVKDNHIRLAGGIQEAIVAARNSHPLAPIEIEVTTPAELTEAVELGVEAVLLDNMTPEAVRQAVAIVAGRCYIEVSGGITLTTLDGYLVPGVDAVSLGALTHSAGHVDMSLEIGTFRC
jgi:nicotinate-nucleotide pyrophosphorylase (carboxylating)